MIQLSGSEGLVALSTQPAATSSGDLSRGVAPAGEAPKAAAGRLSRGVRVARPLTLAQAARLANAALNKDEKRQAAQALVSLAGSAESGAADGLESWLGPAPSDPVALELRSLRQRFQFRRQVLSRTISADEVADLLQTRSRQTPHDRAKAGTLLGIRDNGRLRFPLGQFDPEGPDGVVPGLADVLKALDFSDLAKAAWLERPHPALEGQTPLKRLSQGELAGVLAVARRAGHGQD